MLAPPIGIPSGLCAGSLLNTPRMESYNYPTHEDVILMRSAKQPKKDLVSYGQQTVQALPLFSNANVPTRPDRPIGSYPGVRIGFGDLDDIA